MLIFSFLFTIKFTIQGQPRVNNGKGCFAPQEGRYCNLDPFKSGNDLLHTDIRVYEMSLCAAAADIS